MVIGILANPHKPGAVGIVQTLRAALKSRGIEVVLDTQAAAMLGEQGGREASEFRDLVDLAAVIGGDGTMLHAVSRLGDFGKPVAGVNAGTLGFLTTCKDDEIEVFADALAAKQFTTSERTLLVASVMKGGEVIAEFTALNEITLARGQTGRLVSLGVRVDGEMLNEYRADGLIVGTPTGSTAYSLSAGGPLIAPGAAVFVVTPICPHSLSQRALVLADDCEIELEANESEDPGPMLFTVDGRDVVRIEPGQRVLVRKSPRKFRLVRMVGSSFFQALRQKLGWEGVRVPGRQGC